MLGSSQRHGEIHHHYYHHHLASLNAHFGPPLFFGHQHHLHNQVVSFDKGFCSFEGGEQQQQLLGPPPPPPLDGALGASPPGAYGAAASVVEPTSVLDLWSPSPSSKGGCSGLSGGNTLNTNANGSLRVHGSASTSPPPGSCCFDDNKSNTSVKSVEVRRLVRDEELPKAARGGKGGGSATSFGWSNVGEGGRSRDRSLDEWLADLQQQKLVQGEEEELEFDQSFFPSAPASSSSDNNNNNNGNVNAAASRLFTGTSSHEPVHHLQLQELESMLLSPSTSSAPPPPPPPPALNQQLAKWLLSEQETAAELHHPSFQPLLKQEEQFNTGFEMFYSSIVQAPGKPPPPPPPPSSSYLHVQPLQSPVYHGLEHFLQSFPPFEEPFQHDHQLEAMLNPPTTTTTTTTTTTNRSFTHGYGGMAEPLNWPSEQAPADRKRRAAPPVVDPLAEARAEQESRNRLMLMGGGNVLHPLGCSAFAVPLVPEVKPPRKLQRVHSSSERASRSLAGFTPPVSAALASAHKGPVVTLPSPSLSPSPPGSTTGTTNGLTNGSTTTLPSTISVPDEGGLGLMDQLLQLAQAIDVGSNQLAQSILARLNQHLFCHQGKRIQRLAFYFKEALAARMNSSVSPQPSASSCPGSLTITTSSATTTTTTATTPSLRQPSALISSPLELFNQVRAYTSFCEISPFLRFCYLSANQAILECMQGESNVHIVDFDPRFGSQWSSLLQDLASRTTAVPDIRFTLIGPDVNRLTFVAESLREFANSVRLSPSPRFEIALCENPGRLSPSSLGLVDGETLIFNFMFSLHRALSVPDGAEMAVNALMGASPRLVTVAEQEVDDNEGKFQRRFVETLQYYAFVLDSLGPEDGAGMLTVEKEILAAEIGNAVSEEGVRRTERHERLAAWKGRMSRVGFEAVGMSEVARMQGECLIKRHSHGKNFEVVREEGGMFLGWQGKNLVSVSAWTPADASSAADHSNGCKFKIMNNNNNNNGC